MSGTLRVTGCTALAGLIAGYIAALAGLLFKTEAEALDVPFVNYTLPLGVFLVFVFILRWLLLSVIGGREATEPPVFARRETEPIIAANPLPLPEVVLDAEQSGDVKPAEIRPADGPATPASPEDREAFRIGQLCAVIGATQEGRALDQMLQAILAKAERVRDLRDAQPPGTARESEEYRRMVDTMLREIIADFRAFEQKDPLYEFMYEVGGYYVVGLLAEFGMNNIAYGLYRNMKDDYVKAKIRNQYPDIFSR